MAHGRIRKGKAIRYGVDGSITYGVGSYNPCIEREVQVRNAVKAESVDENRRAASQPQLDSSGGHGNTDVVVLALIVLFATGMCAFCAGYMATVEIRSGGIADAWKPYTLAKAIPVLLVSVSASMSIMRERFGGWAGLRYLIFLVGLISFLGPERGALVLYLSFLPLLVLRNAPASDISFREFLQSGWVRMRKGKLPIVKIVVPSNVPWSFRQLVESTVLYVLNDGWADDRALGIVFRILSKSGPALRRSSLVAFWLLVVGGALCGLFDVFPSIRGSEWLRTAAGLFGMIVDPVWPKEEFVAMLLNVAVVAGLSIIVEDDALLFPVFLIFPCAIAFGVAPEATALLLIGPFQFSLFALAVIRILADKGHYDGQPCLNSDTCSVLIRHKQVLVGLGLMVCFEAGNILRYLFTM